MTATSSADINQIMPGILKGVLTTNAHDLKDDASANPAERHQRSQHLKLWSDDPRRRVAPITVSEKPLVKLASRKPRQLPFEVH